MGKITLRDIMGIFDRLFKKKKTVPRRSYSTQQAVTTSNTPAALTSTTRVYPATPQTPITPQTPKTPKTHVPTRPQYTTIGRQQPRSQPQASGGDGSLLDPEEKRILEESLSNIPKTIQSVDDISGVKTDTITKPKKYTPVGEYLSSISTQPETGEAMVDIKRTVEPTKKSAGITQLHKGETDDDELLKKIVKFDSDLKQIPIIKKGPAKTPLSVGIKVKEKTKDKDKVKRKQISEKDLELREKKLKTFEKKLHEKEKMLNRLDDMNKIFTDIEDTELGHFFHNGEGEGKGAVAEAPPIGVKEEKDIVGEGGVSVSAVSEIDEATSIEDDSEKQFQPIQTLTFSSFIVGPSNRFAHDVSQSVAKTPAEAYNPLFIYSEVGLGKTHLLCAIGNYIQTVNPKSKIVYLSSEKFTNELLDHLRLGEMDKFRDKYRNIDVLLIDDIQFIGGQEGTQEEFFHTFNSLYNAHKQIVITSDRPPKNIAHLKDRLRSRFEGGLIVNIKPPDLGTRTMILHEKAEKDGIYVPDEIINFLAAKVRTNVRTLIGILNRLVAYSSLTDRTLDKTLVEEVLQDVIDEGVNVTSF